MKSQIVVLTLLMAVALLVACDPENPGPQSPPTVVPTITVLPPFLTETPRVTATLTPSITPTPSDTPEPSPTATPVSPTPTASLTPTPPIIGQVISSRNVNVREGPSFSEASIATLEPGDEVETHGASEDQQWIKVRFIDSEGQLVDGWINEPLLDLGDYIPPTIGPSPTPSPTGFEEAFPDGVTPGAFVTATPAGFDVAFASVTPSADLSDKNILAYCRQKNDTPPQVRADETVSIFWSWFVARPELMDEHLENANYEVLLDGRLLQNYEQFQLPIRREGDGNWYVYWYVPVGTLEPGRHEVTFRLTWDEPVNDGYQEFGPGTPNETDEGNCVFTVLEE